MSADQEAELTAGEPEAGEDGGRAPGDPEGGDYYQFENLSGGLETFDLEAVPNERRVWGLEGRDEGKLLVGLGGGRWVLMFLDGYPSLKRHPRTIAGFTDIEVTREFAACFARDNRHTTQGAFLRQSRVPRDLQLARRHLRSDPYLDERVIKFYERCNARMAELGCLDATPAPEPDLAPAPETPLIGVVESADGSEWALLIGGRYCCRLNEVGRAVVMAAREAPGTVMSFPQMTQHLEVKRDLNGRREIRTNINGRAKFELFKASGNKGFYLDEPAARAWLAQQKAEHDRPPSRA